MKPFVIKWDQEGFLGVTSIIRPILSRYSRFFWENFPQLKYKNPQVKFCRSEKKTKAEDILVEFGKLLFVFVQYFVMLITSICLVLMDLDRYSMFLKKLAYWSQVLIEWT